MGNLKILFVVLICKLNLGKSYIQISACMNEKARKSKASNFFVNKWAEDISKVDNSTLHHALHHVLKLPI